MPVHLIEGSVTSIVDRAICQAVRRSVLRHHRSVIKGAGHMMPLTHPTELTRLLVQELGVSSRAPHLDLDDARVPVARPVTESGLRHR